MIKEGYIVKGRITGIKNYGAFVKVRNYDGLIHISEFSDNFVKDISQIVTIGDIVKLEILDVNENDQKLKLSYKKANKISAIVLKYANIVIGFQSLEDNLNNWIEKGLQEVLENNK